MYVTRRYIYITIILLETKVLQPCHVKTNHCDISKTFLGAVAAAVNAYNK